MTHDLWNALHQSGAVLLAFLKDWHVCTVLIWMDIREPSHEEIVVTRGMSVCNKIVGALDNDANWGMLYGDEEKKGEKERQALWDLVFDMKNLEMKREGGVDGDVGVRYANPYEEPVVEGGEVVVDDGKRDVATQTAQLVVFDPLYDYQDVGTQTEGGVRVDQGVQTGEQGQNKIQKGDEEKDRHDSGVGLEMDGAGKELESSDEEGGGALLGSYHRMGLLSTLPGTIGTENVVVKLSRKQRRKKLKSSPARKDEEEQRGRARTRD